MKKYDNGKILRFRKRRMGRRGEGGDTKEKVVRKWLVVGGIVEKGTESAEEKKRGRRRRQ